MSQHYQTRRHNVGVRRLDHNVGVRRLHLLVDRIAASELFARYGPRIVPGVDRFLFRLSGGRVILARARLPALMLTTTGRRSGEPRRAPIACLPEDGGSFLVVGSNFGGESHPAWTANLLAEPHATVSYRARTFEVEAVLLDDDERALVWDRLVEMFPNFRSYEERAGRRLRVFRLTPV
jgi:deazaflavin-dependent oxidoreductase (nitroreductase family)